MHESYIGLTSTNFLALPMSAIPARLPIPSANALEHADTAALPASSGGGNGSRAPARAGTFGRLAGIADMDEA